MIVAPPTRLLDHNHDHDHTVSGNLVLPYFLHWPLSDTAVRLFAPALRVTYWRGCVMASGRGTHSVSQLRYAMNLSRYYLILYSDAPLIQLWFLILLESYHHGNAVPAEL